MTNRRISSETVGGLRGWARACVLASALLLGGSVAQANYLLVPCTPGTGFDYGPTPHVICGGAEAHGEGNGDVFNASPAPFASFLSGSGGSMGVAGGGTGGVAGSAAGSGTFGEVHLYSYADNGQFFDPNSPQKGSAFAQAEIAFVDGGIVNGPAGVPVNIRLTLSMEGAFSGTAEGDFDFILWDGPVYLGERRAFLYSGGPSVSYIWDLTVLGGDSLFFGMDMLAEGGTTNDGGLVTRSVADVSHTGRVFLDVLTPGDGFDSNSGHNYSSTAGPASVPEPATSTALILGLACIVASKRLRRPL